MYFQKTSRWTQWALKRGQSKKNTEALNLGGGQLHQLNR